jgi:hypothetical protein
VRDFLWEWDEEITAVAFMKFAEEIAVTKEMFEFMRDIERKRRDAWKKR